jgi:hypothetical protein
MGVACRSHWRDKKCIIIQWEELGERAHLGDINLDGRIILRRTLEK